MADGKRITFIQTHKVQQHDGNGPEYKKGETYNLHPSYAEKYKRLGYAVDAAVEEAAATTIDGLRTDGPTLAVYVNAGYLAENYPPQGYAAVEDDDYRAELERRKKPASDPSRGDGNDPPSDQVEIPDNWRALEWPAMRSLAARLTPKPVKKEKDAVAAIEAELAKRAASVPKEDVQS